MRTIKLHDGQSIQLPSSMSDLDVQRVVKLLLEKMGKLSAEETKKDILVINTPDYPEYPELPEFPKPNNYTAELGKIAKALGDRDGELLAQMESLNKSVAYLGAKIDAQTNALVKLSLIHI